MTLLKEQLNKSETNLTIQKSKTDKFKSIKAEIDLYKSISSEGTPEEIAKKNGLFYKITNYLDEEDEV